MVQPRVCASCHAQQLLASVQHPLRAARARPLPQGPHGRRMAAVRASGEQQQQQQQELGPPTERQLVPNSKGKEAGVVWGT